MDAPEAEVLRLLESRDHAEHPLLLGDPEPGLEAHQVPHLPRPVLAAKLYHRVRLAAGARVGQPDRLHRAEPERLAAAPRHLLHRQAALEVRHRVELVALMLVGLEQRVEELRRMPAASIGALR